MYEIIDAGNGPTLEWKGRAVDLPGAGYVLVEFANWQHALEWLEARRAELIAEWGAVLAPCYDTTKRVAPADVRAKLSAINREFTLFGPPLSTVRAKLLEP